MRKSGSVNDQGCVLGEQLPRQAETGEARRLRVWVWLAALGQAIAVWWRRYEPVLSHARLLLWQGGLLKVVLRRLERETPLLQFAGVPATKPSQPLTGAALQGRSPTFWRRSPLVPPEPYAVPLAWAATTLKQPYANLGDALSPVVISALSNLPVRHQRFDAPTERFASVGTIGHGLRNGTVHLWGTGIDPTRNVLNPQLGRYELPPETQFVVHAMRGPFSARTFASQGVDVPPVYGDPIWFLPAIIPPAPWKQYELGIVVHLSELDGLSDTAAVKQELVRYRIPPALQDSVKIITTVTQPTFEALEQRVRDITACKRILSTSLHGLVIAETYSIPCAYFRPVGQGTAQVSLADETEPLDHRMRDFYSGLGLQQLLVWGQPRHRVTNWEQAIADLDRHWQPLEWAGAERFLEAYPLPLQVNPLQQQEIGDRALFARLRF